MNNTFYIIEALIQTVL